MTTTTLPTLQDAQKLMKGLEQLHTDTKTLSPDRLRAKAGALANTARNMIEGFGMDNIEPEHEQVFDMVLSVGKSAKAMAESYRPKASQAGGANPNDLFGLADAAPSAAQWIDAKTGRPVLVLERGQKLTDHVGQTGSMGKAIRGIVTGDWTGAEFEQSALSTTNNGSAGFLVDDTLSAGVIDLARNKSVLMNMGAMVMPMPTARVEIARLVTDPVHEVKGENLAFTGSTLTFDRIGMTAKTLGTVITMSNELLQDSINGASAIESALADSLAVEIDRQLLVGSGSGEISGISRTSGIGSTGSVGSLTYDDILDAMKDLEDGNEAATGWVTNPLLMNVLRKLKTGDGTNSAASYLIPPPDVASLRKMTSNQIPTGELYVADWSKIIVGVRLAATIETSRDADSAFDKYQTKIRIVWRGDANIERPAAFHKLSGATA